MSVQSDVAERFPKDVSEHVMTVLRDDGVSRHIRFRRPGTMCMGFDIVTWPGVLCYTGDMGTYVFQRLEDMFEFFRDNAAEPSINPRYWGEKVIAQDYDGVQKFSVDVATQHIGEWMTDNEVPAHVRAAILSDVMPRAFDSEHDLREAMRDFELEGVTFGDLYWEARFSEHTYRFLWCCHALVWAIRQYDATTESSA